MLEYFYDEYFYDEYFYDEYFYDEYFYDEYFYDESGQLIAEHTTSGAVQKEYVYLNAQVIGFIQNNTLYYVHNDHLGRAERITNNNTATVWRASNYAFDRTVTTDSIGGYNWAFRDSIGIAKKVLGITISEIMIQKQDVIFKVIPLVWPEGLILMLM